MVTPPRLYFIDALRAFAILMMLQGHFISGLLNPMFKDPSNPIYLGCTVVGLLQSSFLPLRVAFTFLSRNPVQGWKNPRVKRLKRTLELLFWGYLLRLNLPMLLNGQINNSFIYPDVLQIIGLSLSLTILLYGCFHFMQRWAGLVFLGLGLLIFITQPLYVDMVLEGWPNYIAGYFSKANKGGLPIALVWLCLHRQLYRHLFNPHTEQLWAWGLGFCSGLLADI